MRSKEGKSIVKWGGRVVELPSDLVREHDPRIFFGGFRGPLLLRLMKMVEELEECYCRDLIIGEVPRPDTHVVQVTTGSARHPEIADTIKDLAKVIGVRIHGAHIGVVEGHRVTRQALKIGCLRPVAAIGGQKVSIQ